MESCSRFNIEHLQHVHTCKMYKKCVLFTNHTSRLVHVCRNDPEIKWLPQSMYYV